MVNRSNKSESLKKTRKFVVRFDQETAEFINDYAELVGTNKTQLIRNAVTSAVFLNTGNLEYFNPKSIMSQSLLHFLFERCSDQELKELAQISYDLSMVELQSGALKNSIINSPQDLARNLVKYIYSPLGHGWFDEINYIQRGKNITIYGKHNLGTQFHKFVRELTCLYFKMVDYEIIRERQDTKLVEYNYTKVTRRFYSLSFTFTPIMKS